MPMVQLRGAHERAQWTYWEADVGMDINGPEPAESEHSGNGFQGKAHDEGRQVNQAHRVNRINRMLAMGGQPVEVFGTVMNGMKPPEKADLVLQSVAPIHGKVAQENH